MDSQAEPGNQENDDLRSTILAFFGFLRQFHRSRPFGLQILIRKTLSAVCNIVLFLEHVWIGIKHYFGIVFLLDFFQLVVLLLE